MIQRYRTFDEMAQAERLELAGILRMLKARLSERRTGDERTCLCMVAMNAIACSDVDLKARQALSRWVMRWI